MEHSSNKHIFKNTIFLYIRMLFVMGVAFFTTRVVLNTLGVDDYGIYNLVGSVVVMFTFLNSSMTACTQRYLCVAIGKEDSQFEKEVFSTSIVAHIFISVLFLIIAETVGLWFVLNVINLPPGTLNVAIIVYQFSVLTAVVNILRVPYNGAIVANEKMDFYAYSSIVETILKFAILLPLIWISANKLILYAGLVAIVGLLIFLWYHIYVYSNFPNCHIRIKDIKTTLLKEMLKFTGWSNFSSIANMGAKQGMGIIMNHFLGIIINAAVGIMNQVTSAIYGFITNFLTAINPPLIKLYVAKEWNNLEKLFVESSRLAFYLMIILSFPIILNIEPILVLWLKEVPTYTASLCVFSLLSLLPNVFGGPVWTIIQASGQISRYQMKIGFIILLNLPFDCLLLYFNFPPYWLLCVAMIINIIVDFVGIGYVCKFTSITWKTVCSKIVWKCLAVAIVAFFICFFAHKIIDVETSLFINILFEVLIDLLLTVFIIFSIGFSSSERKSVVRLLKK